MKAIDKALSLEKHVILERDSVLLNTLYDSKIIYKDSGENKELRKTNEDL